MEQSRIHTLIGYGPLIVFTEKTTINYASITANIGCEDKRKIIR